jgi:Signal peptidase, peptidase S26
MLTMRHSVRGRGQFAAQQRRSGFAICSNANCRFPNDVLEREIFTGDRILVNKFPYEFGNPERWDVIVFKFPQDAKTNYIKRCVALCGEEVRLEQGDVKVRPLGSDDRFQIVRKSPEKQRQLQILVHSNDHPATELLGAGWPEAWAPVEEGAWKAVTGKRSFEIKADAGDDQAYRWLRYTHYLPTPIDWSRALAGKKPATPKPQHIKDFYAYNARIMAQDSRAARRESNLAHLSVHDEWPQWVGDLTLNCQLETLSKTGEVVFELIEGARAYRATINLETGHGALSYHLEDSDDPNDFAPLGGSFVTEITGPGKYKIGFANVDDRVCLWIGNRLVKSIEFNDDEKFIFAPQKTPIEATDNDRSPVGIAASKAALRVSHLLIERDVYYASGDAGGGAIDGKTYALRDDPDDANDEYLMLGDNNPKSNDSRLWSHHAVQRRLLIGKAFFIYWPHGVPFLNGGRGFATQKVKEAVHGDNPPGPPLPQFSMPFYPYFDRMHRIR